jgi:uncharacterized protein (TIGR03663 family)
VGAADSPCRNHGVNQSADTVLQRPDFRSGGVRPLDGKLDDAEAKDLGPDNRLDIKPETVLANPRKDRPGRVAPERLETALGVRDRSGAKAAKHAVEEPPARLAQERLPHRNDAFGMTPTPDQDIAAVTGLEKIADRREGHAQVGIHEQDPFATGPEHPGFDRKSLPARLGIFHHHKTGIAGHHVPGQVRRVIQALLHNEQKLPRLIGKNPADFPQSRRKPCRLIAGRDDNTDGRSLISHGSRHYPNCVLQRLSKLPWPEIAILGAAVVLRVWLIELKPAHFDEGVNGWFVDQMTANGYYRYDPNNFHGPLHFYAVFLAQTLLGRALWVLRLPTIIAGVLCVWAMLRYRDFFGTTVARISALALAISPAFVFFSRSSIHESWQALFSILLLHSLLGLWQSGERGHLRTCAFAITGLILTKETYILHLGCFALAIPVLWLWQKVVPSRPEWPVARQQWTRQDLLVCVGMSLFAIVFFYSGTFQDFAALRGLYETFAVWFRTGVEQGGHEKPSFDLVGKLNYYWVALMARYEWPALVGLLACVRLLFPCDARLRYIAIMACGILGAYSIIPYKTPWCVVSIIWPLYLTGAAGLAELGRKFFLPDEAWALAFPLLAVSLIASVRLNFHRFTDDSEPYVYVQTYEDINVFTGPLLEAAHKDATKFHVRGIISMGSDYPLPWILGDFTKIGYCRGDQPPSDWNMEFIAVDSVREGEVERNLNRPYFKRRFHLRSAQEGCTAYFSADTFSTVINGTPEFPATVVP